MLLELDHINIRTANLAGMSQWYEAVLGMRVGPRPEFPFGGAWLYSGDRPVVHLVETDETEQANNATQIEHMAFKGEDLTKFVAHLIASKIDYRESLMNDPVASMIQVHVKDIDGNHIHIDFHGTP